MKCIGLAFALALLASTANAQGITIEAGKLDCGQWAKARKEQSSSHYETFIVGFLNGLALGRDIEFWQPRGKPNISWDSVQLWMDSYCQKKPLELALTGAIKLFNERSGWQP